ncbi:Neural cell adhesion molecule 2 [Portunus trituberculatus]|uniref:Neural cell adhesion molecule 2 n=1 Tax=Portunus trituberculatus TaxID=210409 RepID=A0A5B7HSE4_PORTR|nr:Neural cell adhesion molecule 2 [Portunus trituberculatus]
MCDITGDPEPTVSWSFEGKKISYGDKYSKVSETSNNLIVSNVTLSDAGTYVCKAVQVSPRITEMKDKEIDVKVHRELISCEVTNPFLTVQLIRYRYRFLFISSYFSIVFCFFFYAMAYSTCRHT